jgi:hypothetical protein
LAVFLVIGLAQRQSHYGRTDWASRLVRRQIGHAAKTTAGIWKVSQPDLEAILFRLPPTEVQQCLVVKVASLFALADAIAARRAAARARVERLTSALLAKIHEDVPGGVPLKMWTRGVPVEDEAKRQLTNAARCPSCSATSRRCPTCTSASAPPSAR